jgi:heterogeneous nuclear ribonucleoprotein R
MDDHDREPSEGLSQEEEEVAQEEEAQPSNSDGGDAPPTNDPLTWPPHGTEIFVGNLPRALIDPEQLRSFLEQVGEIHCVELKTDPNNPAQNRGFAFVTFKTVEAALAAEDRFDGKEIPDFPGRKIRVTQSTVKNKLYIGGIDPAMTRAKLLEELNAALKGVVHVRLLNNRENPELSRGFAFVDFYNSRCADLARNIMGDAAFRLGGRQVTIDAVGPTTSELAQRTVRSIFVGSLPEGATEDQLKGLFGKYGEVEGVKIPRPRPGEARSTFGFVTFVERAAAARAVADVEGRPEIDTKQLTVKYGRPDQQAMEAGRGGGGGGHPMQGGGSGRGGCGGYYNRGGGGGGGFRGRGRGRDGGGGFGGRGGGGGYDGGGYGGGGMMGASGMMMGGMGGMVSLVPVQLPTGQMAYMMNPGMAGMMGMAGMGDGGMGGGGGVPMRGGGGYRGGGRGGWRGGGGRGGPRYQPY